MVEREVMRFRLGFFFMFFVPTVEASTSYKIVISLAEESKAEIQLSNSPQLYPASQIYETPHSYEVYK